MVRLCRVFHWLDIFFCGSCAFLIPSKLPGKERSHHIHQKWWDANGVERVLNFSRNTFEIELFIALPHNKQENSLDVMRTPTWNIWKGESSKSGQWRNKSLCVCDNKRTISKWKRNSCVWGVLQRWLYCCCFFLTVSWYIIWRNANLEFHAIFSYRKW